LTGKKEHELINCKIQEYNILFNHVDFISSSNTYFVKIKYQINSLSLWALMSCLRIQILATFFS